MDNGILCYKMKKKKMHIIEHSGSIASGREILRGYMSNVEMDFGDRTETGRVLFNVSAFPNFLHIEIASEKYGRIMTISMFGSHLYGLHDELEETDWFETYLPSGHKYGPYTVWHSKGNWVIGLSGVIVMDSQGNVYERWKVEE